MKIKGYSLSKYFTPVGLGVLVSELSQSGQGFGSPNNVKGVYLMPGGVFITLHIANNQGVDCISIPFSNQYGLVHYTDKELKECMKRTPHWLKGIDSLLPYFCGRGDSRICQNIETIGGFLCSPEAIRGVMSQGSVTDLAARYPRYRGAVSMQCQQRMLSKFMTGEGYVVQGTDIEMPGWAKGDGYICQDTTYVFDVKLRKYFESIKAKEMERDREIEKQISSLLGVLSKGIAGVPSCVSVGLVKFLLSDGAGVLKLPKGMEGFAGTHQIAGVQLVCGGVTASDCYRGLRGKLAVYLERAGGVSPAEVEANLSGYLRSYLSSKEVE